MGYMYTVHLDFWCDNTMSALLLRKGVNVTGYAFNKRNPT